MREIFRHREWIPQSKNSHRRCSIKKGKHLCQNPSFNKVAGLRPATFLKKELWHRYFSVNFAKFLRTLFLQNTSGRLLLSVPIPSTLDSVFLWYFSGKWRNIVLIKTKNSASLDKFNQNTTMET